MLKLGLGLFLLALAHVAPPGAPAMAQGPGEGDLFVVSSNCCGGGGVVRVNPATGTQTVVTSPGGFTAPFDIVLAPDGNLFVADSACCGGTGGVIQVNPTTGGQAVISSGGHFARPRGIVLASGGDLFVADSACCGGTGGVIRVNPATGTQTLVSSGGNFSFPTAIAETLSGDLVVADSACCGGTGGVIRVNPTTGAQEVLSGNALGVRELRCEPADSAGRARCGVSPAEEGVFPRQGGLVRVRAVCLGHVRTESSCRQAVHP
jgi:DNA-binding beta-propeller fold protein YncE